MEKITWLQRRLESLLPPGIILQTATDAVAVFVVRVIGVGLGFLANVALARWLGLAGYSSYSFILAVAATEVSVGLALIVWAYRRTGSVDPENYNLLK